jgi:DNA-binding response OmpR family regulator
VLEKSQKPPLEGLVVDLLARRVWAGGKEIPLRRKEFDLLAFLYENRGKACNRDEIAQKVWVEESGIVSLVLTYQISCL